jgi:NTE family protein
MAQNTAACNKDFDKLMVPFRCVSTDIYRNEAVIHRDGYLEEAIRASMTIPLVYKPIEIDGVLLYDGGMQNNFPVDVMVNDFKPDIVIGHKVSEDGDKADPDDLFKQIENMVMQLTNYKIPDSVGILIESKMRDVGLLDFHKVNYAYSRGIESALHMIDSIEQRVERRMSSDVLAQKRNDFKKKKPELLFNNVQVEGITDNMQRKYIIQSVKNKENIFDIDQLRESYFKLISDEHIKAIRPIARYNSMTGLYDLQLKVEPRQPLDLELGGNVTTRSYSFGFIQANYKGFKTVSYTLTSNVYFGRFYNSFLLGGRIDSPSRKPFYVSAYKTFNQWDYFATSTDLYFSDIRPPYVLRRENNFSLEAGVPYTKTGLFTIGASQANLTDTYYQTKDFKQDDKLDQTKFNSYVFDATFNIKKFDYKQYPTEGANKFLGLYFISGTENFKPGTTSPITGAFTANHNYFQLARYLRTLFPLQQMV